MYAKFIFRSYYLPYSTWKERQGFPDIRTVDYWLGGDKTERFPQSRSVAFLDFASSFLNCHVRINNNHNKADGFERRIEVSYARDSAIGYQNSQDISYTWWKISSTPLTWRGTAFWAVVI